MRDKFPIINDGTHDPWREWVPWDFVAAHRMQIQENHSQSLERLADRGGLSPLELCVAIMYDTKAIHKVDWHSPNNHRIARRNLTNLIQQWQGLEKLDAR